MHRHVAKRTHICAVFENEPFAKQYDDDPQKFEGGHSANRIAAWHHRGERLQASSWHLRAFSCALLGQLAKHHNNVAEQR